MNVRAKFRCDAITHLNMQIWDNDARQTITRPARSIRFTPVFPGSDKSHENAKFWAATPSGTIEIQCVNADAVEGFEVGKEYYVDFTPADRPSAPHTLVEGEAEQGHA